MEWSKPTPTSNLKLFATAALVSEPWYRAEMDSDLPRSMNFPATAFLGGTKVPATKFHPSLVSSATKGMAKWPATEDGTKAQDVQLGVVAWRRELTHPRTIERMDRGCSLRVAR